MTLLALPRIHSPAENALAGGIRRRGAD